MSAETPICPDCGEPMTFDGIGYVCLCQLRRKAYGSALPFGGRYHADGAAAVVKSLRDFGSGTQSHTGPYSLAEER